MKLKSVLLLTFLIPSFLFAQDFYKKGYFVVKGKVDNSKAEFLEYGLTTYFDNKRGSIKITKDGSFEQNISVQHRQKFYIQVHNEFVSFTVLDKDTLYLHWDEADFKKSFSINGKNALRTRELQIEAKLYLEYSASMENYYKGIAENAQKLSPEQHFEMVNTLYNQQVKAVLSFDSFLTEMDNQLITGLYFKFTNLLRTQSLLPKFKLKLNLDSTSSYPFFDMADSSADYTVLNEFWFWNVPEYRDFVFDYVRFYRPFTEYRIPDTGPQKPFNPTLDEYYLAQSNISYTSIQDWFIAKSIMFGFEYYSFADVEKVYRQYVNICTVPYLKDTLQKYYTAIKRLKPGNPAPGFKLKNDKGQPVSLSDFKGKVVYIDFWGVGCGPCIDDIKNAVPGLHQKYKDKDVVFINICVDAKENEWKEALAKYQLSGVNLIAEGWSNHPVCKAYNVSGAPHYVLVDKNGKMANNNAPRAYELNAITNNNPIDVLLN